METSQFAFVKKPQDRWVSSDDIRPFANHFEPQSHTLNRASINFMGVHLQGMASYEPRSLR